MLSKSTSTRRQVLIGSIATAAVIPFGHWLTRKGVAQTPTFIRREVYTLDPAGPELSAYGAGILAMQSLPNTDPRSWIFQANMHGAQRTNPAFRQCQHGNFYFFPWHRMYLYFFERIVRAFSGDPTFALPYWNYFPAPQRVLPSAFRLPADTSTNPLFVAERSAGANGGLAMRRSAVDHARAFQVTNFTDADVTFGGPRVSAPIFRGPSLGELERTPHNSVHTLVGGSDGFMSSLASAPRDPIFWLHHSNIDRLWKRWLDQGGGRANPADTGWLDTPFPYLFDEDANQIQMTPRDVLDTMTQLDYGYDDDPPSGTQAELTVASAADQPGSAHIPERVLAETGAQQLDAETVVITLGVTTGVSEDEFTTADQLLLKIDDVIATARGVYYEVYVNLPGNALPSERSPFYVGNLTLFGLTDEELAAMDMGAHHAAGDIFDITTAIRQARNRGSWDPDRIKLTFIPISSERLTQPSKAIATLGALRVIGKQQ